MRNNIGGAENVAVGDGALFANVGGTFNTAIGNSALVGNTDGTFNTAIGSGAGGYITGGVTENTTADNSVYVGYAAYASQSNGQNEIVIGANNTGFGSNSVTLGNSSITQTILRPTVKIQGSGSTLLHVSGSGGNLFSVVDSGSNFPTIATFSSGSVNVLTITTSSVNVIGQLKLESYTTTASYTGTSAGVLAFDASGNILTIATPSGGGGGTVTGQLILTAGGGWPSITNGCQSPTLAQTTTNAVNFYYLGFADAVQTFANWAMPMPSDYNGGTITAVFYWAAPSATADSVVWGIQARAYNDSDALDAAFGTAQTVTDANNSAIDDVNISAATSAITIAGTPSAGSYIQFRVYRDGAAGGDTLAAVAELLSVRITYTRT
jgi:hypothetical protein